jgi:hypothetical protein
MGNMDTYLTGHAPPECITKRKIKIKNIIMTVVMYMLGHLKSTVTSS